VAQQPTSGLGRLIVEIPIYRTISAKTRYDSSERVISSIQGRYLYNTTDTRDEYPCPQRNSNPRSQH